MKRLSRLLVLLPALVLGWVLLSGSALQAYHWGLPAWVPRPVEPADNPMSAAKVELGRHLFYDQRLSADNSMSCASCHHQDKAFTDGRALSEGVTKELSSRSAMSLALSLIHI
jgi:cytochrome c peroxidase